jgi:protein-L-isoaspartate(D-aspartate) O-methyltransferase
MIDFIKARLNMVESQIRTNKVTDEGVIAAFEATPREVFVPRAKRGIAYVDEAIDIGSGRYMLEPMVLARLLQTALPAKGDLALDIGCGTGYATAILSKMVSTVVGIDDNADLVASGNACLSELVIENAALVEGALTDGYAKGGPYNVILINGAVDEIPDTVFDQLADGGRLVTVKGGSLNRPGLAMLYEKYDGRVAHRILFDAGTPALPGFKKAAGFVF